MAINAIPSNARPTETVCYHCGIPTDRQRGVSHDEKLFCCIGCRTVYEILSKNAMCEFYDFEKSPGTTPVLRQAPKFAYLDDLETVRTLIDFSNDELSVVTLTIPQIHCSSCIWLLENLHKLEKGILFSRVDFLKKKLFVRFAHQRTTLRSLVELLASLGYEPELNLGTVNRPFAAAIDRSLYIRIGIAAFCFANIMLFSLPEYFDSQRQDMASREFFAYLNMILSVPVVLYSAGIFFLSAYQGVRKRVLNIDVPIALGIGLIFVRSAADVLDGSGPGYFDSLTGLVFFLLLGRLFQNKTYDNINFDRTYQSYFPLAVTVKRSGTETTAMISSLRPGERIIIRNNEVIPADAVVMNGTGAIDYSFVTGESDVTERLVGEVVYAGGKQTGGVIELEIIKEASQSTFVQLWNNFSGPERSPSRLLTLSNTIGKWFTAGILALAAATALGWWFVNPAKILDAVTAILIVACPCALALAAPFSLGTTMRLFGRAGLYLKNTAVVEAMAKADTIVFDKTGTLTHTASSTLKFSGSVLSEQDRRKIASLARSSTHPLSRAIADRCKDAGQRPVEEFEERESRGTSGVVDESDVKLGSASFVGTEPDAQDPEHRRTRVYVSIDGKVLGRFEFENSYRHGLGTILEYLGNNRKIHLLSGDSEGERTRLAALYSGFTSMRFGYSPKEKMEYIRALQADGKKVLMFGDGLNDAGALWQSDIGVAVTEDVNNFSPACDAMLDARSFDVLDRLLEFTRTTMKVVAAAIAISLVYNIAGLWFAIRAELSPLLAAILMPLSSVTVVVFSTVTTRWLAARAGIPNLKSIITNPKS